MKQLLRKEFVPQERSPLSLVGAAPKRAAVSDSFDVSEHVLKTSFHGWLCSVSPEKQWHHLQPLTTLEFLQVSLSTVRESSSHRCWPRDVVETFMAAEVIPLEW